MTREAKNKIKFIMDTDWLFKGTMDAEQKQYVLLNYFQKLNKHLEEMKIYPMFTELTLHLGNIQNLVKENKLIYPSKKLSSYDEEFLLSDLKFKKAPEITGEDFKEYQKILSYSYPRFLEYFGITKSFWGIVYNSILVNLKKNKNNLDSKIGFFYFETKDKIYVWQYNMRLIQKPEKHLKTNLTKIYEGDFPESSIYELIKKNVSINDKRLRKTPIFEVVCKDIFPIDETLLPLFKRKILAYIYQNKRKDFLLDSNKNGIS